MVYKIRIKRQKEKNAPSYWQEFSYEGEENISVAGILNELNSRTPLKDLNGKEAETISWECGCMVRKCGACAMRINGVPRLACATFLNTLKRNIVTLEPLSKFPLIKDLTVDRSFIFDKLKEINLWLESDAYQSSHTHEARYQSAKCLMCGCCLEICPNFSIESDFAGAVAPVNAFRIFDEEQDDLHYRDLLKEYKKHYFAGCGKSLSCQDICPAGIPVEELMVRSNAAGVWK